LFGLFEHLDFAIVSDFVLRIFFPIPEKRPNQWL